MVCGSEAGAAQHGRASKQAAYTPKKIVTCEKAPFVIQHAFFITWPFALITVWELFQMKLRWADVLL